MGLSPIAMATASLPLENPSTAQSLAVSLSLTLLPSMVAGEERDGNRNPNP